MKLSRFLGILMLIAAAALTLSISANALSVSPGRTTVNFEPDLDTTMTLRIVNSQQKDFQAAVFVRGELGKYVQLSDSFVDFKANESTKEIKASLKLSEKLARPGVHSSDIVVREISSLEGNETINVGALVSVVSEIRLNVPYPGKFVEADLNVLSPEGIEGEAKFFVRVSGKGSEEINNATAMIFIYDSGSNEVGRVSTGSRHLSPGENSELSAAWKPKNPGSYKAVAVVNYDGSTAKSEKQFLVGKFFLKPVDISVKNFRLGEIAKFSILVENVGNTEVKSATSRIILDDASGRIAELRSVAIDVPAFQKKEMESFWDTEGVKPGDYKGKLILEHDSKSLERELNVRVASDSIKVEIAGVTGFVTKAEAKKEANWLLIAAILASVLAAAGMAFYFLRRKE